MLFHQAQIDANTLTFAESISMVKKIEATVEHSKQRKNNDEQPDVFQLRMEGTVKGKCSKCGRQIRDCPAFGKICYKCDRKNHFSNMCDSKNDRQHINAVTNSTQPTK